MASSGNANEQVLKLIDDLQECIQALSNEFKATSIPISDDNVNLYNFWTKFEHLLERELKEKHGLLGSRKTYWDYFCKCLASKRFIHDGLKYVKSVNEFKTSLGRGRAFIRFCLMNRCLADTLQQCLQDESKTREFFCERSLFFQLEHRSTLISVLYDLNEIQFDLSPVGHDLDVGWPTFTKKISESSTHWRAPSRTISLSSLVSQNESCRETGETSALLDQEKVTGCLYDVEEAANEQIETEDSNKHISDSNLSDTTKTMNASFWQQQEAELSSQLQHMEVSEKARMETVENVTSPQPESDENHTCLENELLAKIADLEAEKNVLRENVEQLRDESVAKDETVATLTNKLDVLKKENLATNSKTVKELDWLRVEVKRLSDENVRLDEDNTQLTDQIGKWKKCFGASTEKLAIKNKINEHLEKQVAALKEAVAAMKEMMAVKTHETTKLNDLVKELKARNVFKEGNNGSGSSISATESENVTLKSSVKDLTNTVKNLKRMLDDQAEILRQKDDVIAEIAHTITSREVTIKELETRLTHSENHLGQIVEENENLKLNLEKLGGVAEEIKKAEEELEKLESKEKEGEESAVQAETRRDDDDNVGSGSNSNIVGYMLCDPPNLLPADFPELVIFNKTLKRLRSLITEKQDLQIKLKSSNDLNSCLISKVKEQENKLSSVTLELSQTKAFIEQLKTSLSKLQTSESILHYELKEKRGVVEHMKRMLESSRSQWLRIRQKHSESELEWQSLRADFASRAKQGSVESGFTEDSAHTEPLSPNSLQSPSTSSADIPALALEITNTDPIEASSPIAASDIGDLSVSQADDDEDSSEAAVEAPTSRVRMRLQMMEEQCHELYSSLIASLKKSETLEWRLSQLHEEHGGEASISNVETAAREENGVENIPQNDSNFDVVFVPFADEELKKPRGSLSSASPDIDYCANENEDLCDDNLENIEPDVVELDPISTSESIDNENSLSEECELNKPLPLTLAQALPKRVELLRKSKENLEKNMKRMLEQKMESEEREAVRNSELDLLRTSIDDLELMVKRLQSEKLVILKREEESKVQAENKMKKDVEESENRYKMLTKAKDELQERLNNANQQLEDAIAKYEQMEGKYLNCLKDLESCRQELLTLRYETSMNAVQHKELLGKYNDISDRVSKANDLIIEQEQLNLCLEKQLESVKQERDVERMKHNELLDNKSICLTVREEECLELSELLAETMMKLDKSNNEIKALNARLEESKMEKDKLTDEYNVLQGDCLNLKQKVVQLAKDKDVFWKRSEHLSYLQKVHSHDRWWKDGEVTSCLGCNAQFSFILRKHHCRHCGRIFCYRCCSHWTKLASHRRRVRICHECHTHSIEAEAAAAFSRQKEEDSQSLCSYIPLNDMETRTGGDNPEAIIEGASASGSLQLETVPLRSYRSESSLLGRLFRSKSHSSKPKSVIEYDDEFYVITDEDIARSLSKSCPYAPLQCDTEITDMCPIRTIEDLVGEALIHTRIVWLNPGKMYAAPIRIDSKTYLSFYFSCETQSISFNLTLKEDNDDDPDYITPLIPRTQCNCQRRLFKGRISARKPGIYTFLFDNTMSRSIVQKLRFTIKIHKDEADLRQFLAQLSSTFNNESGSSGAISDSDDRDDDGKDQPKSSIA